jgi:drug/metabolite transporter (DMT)-like permease
MAFRHLTAREASVINGLLIVLIPCLVWAFLGEALNLGQLIGLSCVGGGALMVQRRPARLPNS